MLKILKKTVSFLKLKKTNAKEGKVGKASKGKFVVVNT